MEAHVPDYSRPDGSPSVSIRLAWEDQNVPFAETDSHATGETEANRTLSVASMQQASLRSSFVAFVVMDSQYQCDPWQLNDTRLAKALSDYICWRLPSDPGRVSRSRPTGIVRSDQLGPDCFRADMVCADSDGSR